MFSHPSPPPPPTDKDDLLLRAAALAGRSLEEITNQYKVPMPDNLQRHKGWVGQLFEHVLGADAGTRAEPDFRHLNIELKTIPIAARGWPKETTFICNVPLLGEAGYRWEDSWVCNKLRHVLWIPVEGERTIPLAQRGVGMPILWQPNRDESRLLQSDWEELMEMVRTGHVEKITARLGEVLQIRPKAANSRIRSDALGTDGELIQTNPRGFYLRKNFTGEILKRNFIG